MAPRLSAVVLSALFCSAVGQTCYTLSSVVIGPNTRSSATSIACPSSSSCGPTNTFVTTATASASVTVRRRRSIGGSDRAPAICLLRRDRRRPSCDLLQQHAVVHGHQIQRAQFVDVDRHGRVRAILDLRRDNDHAIIRIAELHRLLYLHDGHDDGLCDLRAPRQRPTTPQRARGGIEIIMVGTSHRPLSGLRTRSSAGEIVCGGECIDPESEMSSCGRCGHDCGKIANAFGVGCEQGRCVVCAFPTVACSISSLCPVSCTQGYRVAADGASCTAL